MVDRFTAGGAPPRSPRVVAFVHAKGTSQRCQGKNMRVLGDRPLFLHAIAHALACERVDRVVIDSESDEILRLGETHGAWPLERPAHLATNRTSGDELALHQAQSHPDSHIVLQVVPTSPFLRPQTIEDAIRRIDDEGVDSVVATHSDAFYRWKRGRPAYYREDGTLPNSFEMDPLVYETTGLYVNRTTFVLREGKRMNPESCVAHPVSRLESVDINTDEDFAFAELLYRGMMSR